MPVPKFIISTIFVSCARGDYFLQNGIYTTTLLSQFNAKFGYFGPRYFYNDNI
jgi:hypothetical protein